MRDPRPLERVFVYYNLRKSCWSVKSLAENYVIAHVFQLYLHKCSFHVNESGRKRVLRDRRKNVYAGVTGYVSVKPYHMLMWDQVFYDPYKYETFVTGMERNIPVHEAAVVKFIDNRVYMGKEVNCRM